MITITRLWAISIGIFLLLPALGQSRKPVLAKPAAWVKSIPVDLTQKSSADDDAGITYLLFDVQEHAEQHAAYFHYAYRIVNAEGVQNMSDVSVDFDPSFQKLFFHGLVLHRNGKPNDLLSTHSFQTYQRETDMERFLYDGSVTATVNLKDIRVGDVLEISYTIAGAHPAGGGKYTTTQDLSYTVPVNRLYFSVLTPTARPMHLSYNQTKGEAPRISAEGSYTRYEWDKKNLRPVEEENQIPSWYSPALFVTLTEYNSWAEVVEWALPLYQTSPEKLAKIKTLYGEKIDSLDDLSILKAVRFVQDEVRYLGFEMGIGSFKPNSPEKVFHNRFGDCKDKSMLLVALFRSNGIEAYPMLVNSKKTLALSKEAPSPHAFDHCVVYMRVLGSEYYIDPTISHQGGSLNRLAFPRYHYGLILREGETELHPIPHDARPTVRVREYFNTAEKHGKTDYKIITEYDYSEADRMRAYLARNSNSVISDMYLKYYEELYNHVELVDKLQVTDDERDNSNTLIVTEHYTINDGLWGYENDEMVATFTPSLIQTYLPSLGSSKRKLPYYVGEPIEIIQEIEIGLPYVWPQDYSSFEVQHPAFDYTGTVTVSGQTAVIAYHYTIHEEYVEPLMFADFYEKRQQVDNHISYSLSDQNENAFAETTGEERQGLTLALAFLMGGLWFMVCLVVAVLVFIYYDPKPKPSYENYVGISGGLIIVAIGVLLTPVFYLVDIISSLVIMIGYSPVDSPGMIMLRLLSFGIDITLFVLSLLLALSFFMRRTSTHTLFLVMLCLWIVASILNITMATYTDRESWFYTKEVFRILFTGALWLPFFILSDQVRGTFVKQLRKPQASPFYHPPQPPPSPEGNHLPKS